MMKKKTTGQQRMQPSYEMWWMGGNQTEAPLKCLKIQNSNVNLYINFYYYYFLCLIMLLGWVVRLLDVLFYWIYRYCGHGNAVFVVFLVNLRWFYAYVLQLIWNVCAIGKIFDFQNAVYLSYVHESLALPCKVSYMVKSAWIWFNNLTMIELIPSYVHNTRI